MLKGNFIMAQSEMVKKSLAKLIFSANIFHLSYVHNCQPHEPQLLSTSFAASQFHKFKEIIS
jgi:hypothetical protein